MKEMKYLLKIVFLGCIVFVANSFSSQAGAACVEEFIYDCFDPVKYYADHNPRLITDEGIAYYPCKTWTSGTINCPGTYYMAVYVDPPVGRLVKRVLSETTCPGNVKVEILNGDEIESILRTFPSEQLTQLSVHEIREGKVPVFIRFTCYENGQGNVTFRILCDDDNREEPGLFNIGAHFLLLFGQGNK
jgi:hypothetical protein